MVYKPEWYMKAAQLRAQGCTNWYIADVLGLKEGIVYHWMRPPRKQKKCIVCGQKFAPRHKTARYCSRECWKLSPPVRTEEQKRQVSEKLRQRWREKNPNFRHGRRAGAHEREMIRVFNLEKKGEERCRVCGSSYNLNAHHAVPRSLAPQARFDLRNCLPLCSSCHMKWHRGTPIARAVFTGEEWDYLESLIGPAWLDKRYPVKVPLVPPDKGEWI
jgi:5-methylcytosine-specific restriction endonuclease McrA